MAKLSQLLTLECMLEAYDSLNVHDALVIDCHRQCIEGVVDGINQQLSRLLNSKVHLSFRNVLVANFDTMKNPAHWLKCKLFSDLPKEDSKVLMDKIELMVYQMKSLMLKMFDVNAEYVELFFKKLKNCRKQKYITDYELWKADKPQLTMDLLTEYQAEITADMLQNGILKFDRIPTGEEMEHIDRDKLAKKLKKTRTLSEEFYVECAKLRRYSYWDDEMFKINHHMLCKHLFSIFGKLTSHQHILLFEYDIQMKQIHEDMMKLMREQGESEKAAFDEVTQQEAKAKIKETTMRVVNMMWAEGTLQHKYDHTWIMMTMNETEELPNFTTPTEYLDFMEECGVRDRLPDRSNISKYYDKACGCFPKWTFTDAKEKENIRRNNVGKRFLNLFQRA